MFFINNIKQEEISTVIQTYKQIVIINIINWFLE